MTRLVLTIAALALATFGIAPPAGAQSDHGCLPPVSSLALPIAPAAVSSARLGAGEVAIRFVGHSTFLIESPAGVRIATDYNDYVRPPVVPDIATMNRAHSTHFSHNPEAGITHVLRGWNPNGGAARHDVTLLDVHVRNHVTNLRNISGGTDPDGNSIFVFELAGLCIAHLGHLHQLLSPADFRSLGAIDIVLAPVDGSWTLDLPGMMEVLAGLGARIVIPMHYFGSQTLNRFLEAASASHAIERREDPLIIVSRATLPATPTVIVLPGR